MDEFNSPFHLTVSNLLLTAGFGGPFTLEPIPVGANNRVFRVQAEGALALLKAYFRHPQDTRDRLASEFAFCRFAWENELRLVPRPLAADFENHLGLYEFIHGRPLQAGEVSGDHVRQACQFWRSLNQLKDKLDAHSLPPASEVCFSIGQHLDRTEGRIKKLAQIDESEPIGVEAADFVRTELIPAWDMVSESIRAQASLMNFSLEEELRKEQQGLSPSDFGFHNVIMGADGSLRFIDFEYAGWDDPARMVCDFFCQPQVPVPNDWFGWFSTEALRDFADSDFHLRRSLLLLPVYRIKWCCIVLNDFLPVGNERRRFALRKSADGIRRHVQLEKAKKMLGALSDPVQ